MTEIKVVTSDDGYMKIEASGHTKSVVCAAVSTLLQSSVRFLVDLADQYPEALKVTIEVKKD